MFISSTLNTVQVKVSQCLTPSRSGKPVTAPPAEDNTQKGQETIILLLHTKNHIKNHLVFSSPQELQLVRAREALLSSWRLRAQCKSSREKTEARCLAVTV